jgi:hypothetical protein
MAALTPNSNPRYNVSGSFKDQFYNITGNSGDTLLVGLISVRQVIVDPNIITGYTVTAQPNGQSLLTFTASGPFTGVNVQVIGN